MSLRVVPASAETDRSGSFELLLLGFRNDVARLRTLAFLRQRAHKEGTASSTTELSVPCRVLTQADFDTATRLSAELCQLGALVRLVHLNDQLAAPALEAAPAKPSRLWIRNQALLFILAPCLVGGVSWFLGRRLVDMVQRSPQSVSSPPSPVAKAQTALSAAKNSEIQGLINRKDFAAAVRQLGAAAKAAPNDQGLHAYRREVYRKWVMSEIAEGRLDSALELIQSADEPERDAEMYALQGQVYSKKSDWHAARVAYERGVELGSKDPEVFLALVSIYRQQGDQKAAVEMLNRAGQNGAKGREFDEMVRLVVTEHDAESDFDSLTSTHFTVSFAQGEDRAAARLILAQLENAYQIVGDKLGNRPLQQTPVVLYAAEAFQQATHAPGWAGGLYDGRIKIPVHGLRAGDPKLAGIMRHEYAHVLNFLIAGENCPVWLNEGVAMWVEEEEEGDREPWALVTVKALPRLKLKQIEKSFAGFSAESAAAAYAYSYLAVRHILKQYGELALQHLLAAFASTSSTEDAFRETLSVELSTFEEDLRHQYDVAAR